MLSLFQFSGHHTIQQFNASDGKIIRQYRRATCEKAKVFIDTIICMKTPWSILCDFLYSMAEEDWKLALEAQAHLCVLPGALVDTPSVGQLHIRP